MSSNILRRIGERHWSMITQIANEEGRPARNVLDLILDRGLAARAEGRWPTPIQRPQTEFEGLSKRQTAPGQGRRLHFQKGTLT